MKGFGRATLNPVTTSLTSTGFKTQLQRVYSGATTRMNSLEGCAGMARRQVLEVLVQPCVPPLKREAGKPEGVYEEQSGRESQGKDEGTRN